MDDNKLKQLLKEQSQQPAKNEWFTPRLLNKLPQRATSTTRWATVLAMVAAGIACFGAWVLYFKTSDFTVITVRDLIYFATLLIVTAIYAWHALRTLVLSDE